MKLYIVAMLCLVTVASGYSLADRERNGRSDPNRPKPGPPQSGENDNRVLERALEDLLKEARTGGKGKDGQSGQGGNGERDGKGEQGEKDRKEGKDGKSAKQHGDSSEEESEVEECMKEKLFGDYEQGYKRSLEEDLTEEDFDAVFWECVDIVYGPPPSPTPARASKDSIGENAVHGSPPPPSTTTTDPIDQGMARRTLLRSLMKILSTRKH